MPRGRPSIWCRVRSGSNAILAGVRRAHPSRGTPGLGETAVPHEQPIRAEHSIPSVMNIREDKATRTSAQRREVRLRGGPG